MKNILIIDDDDQLRISFSKLLKEEKYNIKSAASGEAGVEIVQKENLDLVLLDMQLPGMNGFETFKAIKKIEPKLPVIIITAYGTTESAIEATKLGAYDYVLKPFDIPEMLELIKQAIDSGYYMRAPVKMDAIPDHTAQDVIIGQSRIMQNIYKSIGRVAPTDATVLVRGESGTGKELVCRAIYQHSKRSDKAFLIINCVAIPETLLESELFGYEKGAFTGASHRHIGKIEQANGGTILLDEIGDMPLNIQAKILRLLQEKKIERLGSEETISVDVRIIAATNCHLENAIKEGKFREDLYFRLKVVAIELPPLRDRANDIPQLISYYLEKHSHALGIENPGINKEALELLIKYNWPGNIRELSNTIQKVLIFNRGAPISPNDLEQFITRAELLQAATDGNKNLLIHEWANTFISDPSVQNAFDSYMDECACVMIEEALKQTNGNRSQAAKLLGISRPTLHAKIDKYNLKLHTSIVK